MHDFAYCCRIAAATKEAASKRAAAAKAKHLEANGLTAAINFHQTFAAVPPKKQRNWRKQLVAFDVFLKQKRVLLQKKFGMSQHYFAYHFTINPVQPGTEIVLASLESLPFESFEETETGLIAYIQEEMPDAGKEMPFDFLDNPYFSVTYKIEKIEQVNWNEEWEKNFEPIDVNGLCYVRAPFHTAKPADFEIVIEPKMSFGTGHHETTYMMIEHLLEMNLKNKTVLDMGCGTAILAILAAKKEALEVDAIDNDSWCYENSLENIERNQTHDINVYLGDAAKLNDLNKKYDVIIANINRNILLQDLAIYEKYLKFQGQILLSGFYRHDIPVIDDKCGSLKLTKILVKERNNWVALKYTKM